MKMFKTKDGNIKIHIGDQIYFSDKCKNYEYVYEGPLTIDLAAKLVQENILDIQNDSMFVCDEHIKNTNTREQIAEDIKELNPFYCAIEVLNRFLRKTKCTKIELCNMLSTINKIYSASIDSLILKEVSKILDQCWNDNINSMRKVYIISCSNNSIVLIDVKNDTNFNTFAYFRTYKEAEFAREVCRFFKKKYITK